MCMYVYIVKKFSRAYSKMKNGVGMKKKRERVIFRLYAANEKKKYPRKSCESKIYRKTEKLTKIWRN